MILQYDQIIKKEFTGMEFQLDIDEISVFMLD